MARGRVATVAGYVLLALGLLFVGQGTGYVRWPASSFMIDQYRWVGWGAAIAVAGLVLVIAGRPRGR